MRLKRFMETLLGTKAEQVPEPYYLLLPEGQDIARNISASLGDKEKYESVIKTAMVVGITVLQQATVNFGKEGLPLDLQRARIEPFYVSNALDCVQVLVEMPFIDNNG